MRIRRWLAGSLVVAVGLGLATPRRGWSARVILRLPGTVPTAGQVATQGGNGSPLCSNSMVAIQRLALVDLDDQHRPHFAAWQAPASGGPPEVHLASAQADGSGLAMRPLRGVRGGPVDRCGALATSASGRHCWLTVQASAASPPPGAPEPCDRLLWLAVDGEALAQWAMPRFSLDTVLCLRAVGEETVYLGRETDTLRFVAGQAEPDILPNAPDLIDRRGWAWTLERGDRGDGPLIGLQLSTRQSEVVHLGPAPSRRFAYRLFQYEPGTGLDLFAFPAGRWPRPMSPGDRQVLRLNPQGRSRTLMHTGHLRGPWRRPLQFGAALAADPQGTVWTEGQESGSPAAYYLLKVQPTPRRSLLARWLSRPSREARP